MNSDIPINPDTRQPAADPAFTPEQLTAWALGEAETLDEGILAAIEATAGADAAVREEADAIRAMAALVTGELAAEPVGELATEQRATILARAERKYDPRTNRRWKTIVDTLRGTAFATWPRAVATVVAVVFIGLPVMRWGSALVGYQVAQLAEEMYAWQYMASNSSAHDNGARDGFDERAWEALHGNGTPPSLADYLLWRDRSGQQAQVAVLPSSDYDGESQAAAPAVGLALSDATAEAAFEPTALWLAKSATQAPAAQRMARADLAARVPGSAAGTDAVESTASADAVPPPSDPNRKIIKDATLSIEVASVDLALSRIGAIAAQAGGYVLDTNTDYTQHDYKKATVKIGVPVDGFEATVARIRAIATKVFSDQSSGADVSQEYVDVQSQIANLEATQARIRRFLDQATSVEESLSVNARLTEIEGQISQLKGRLQYLAGRAAYSTITVQLQEPMATPTITPTPTVTPTPTPVLGWDPRKPAGEAFGTLRSLLQVLATLGIWVGIVVMPFALPVGLAWWVARGRKRLQE